MKFTIITIPFFILSLSQAAPSTHATESRFRDIGLSLQATAISERVEEELRMKKENSLRILESEDPSCYKFASDSEALILLNPRDFLTVSRQYNMLWECDMDYMSCGINENRMKRLGFKEIKRDEWVRPDVKVVYSLTLDQAAEFNTPYIEIEFKKKSDADAFFNKVKELNWEENEEGEDEDVMFMSHGINNSDLLIGVIIRRESPLNFSFIDY